MSLVRLSFTNATTDVVFVAANMRLFNVITRTFVTINGRSYIAAPSWMRLMSLISLSIARKPMMKFGLWDRINPLSSRPSLIYHFGNVVRYHFVVTSGAIIKEIVTVNNHSIVV